MAPKPAKPRKVTETWDCDEEKWLLQIVEPDLKTYKTGTDKQKIILGKWTEELNARRENSGNKKYFHADGRLNEKSESAVANKISAFPRRARNVVRKSRVLGKLKTLLKKTGAPTTFQVFQEHKDLVNAVSKDSDFPFSLYLRVWRDDPNFELRSTDMGLSDSEEEDDGGRGKRVSHKKKPFSPNVGSTYKRKNDAPSAAAPDSTTDVVDLVGNGDQETSHGSLTLSDGSPGPIKKKIKTKSSKSSQKKKDSSSNAGDGVAIYNRGMAASTYRQQQAVRMGAGAIAEALDSNASAQEGAQIRQTQAFFATSAAMAAVAMATLSNVRIEAQKNNMQSLDKDLEKAMQEQQRAHQNLLLKQQEAEEEWKEYQKKRKEEERTKKSLKYSDGLDEIHEEDDMEAALGEEKVDEDGGNDDEYATPEEG